MKKVSRGKKTILIAATCFFGVAVIGIGITWLSTASATQKEAGRGAESQDHQIFYSHIRNGVGSVQFATTGTADQEAVSRSVDSVASFIQDRSGLGLSDNTRQKLEALELQTLSGESRRLSAGELADVLTEAATQRLSVLTNEQIDEIAATLSQGSNSLALRANGAGDFSSSDFVDQAKQMRSLGQAGDENLRSMVHDLIEGEINRRLQVYSEALPERFGEAATAGLTPLQAVLLTYSIAADDLLGGSRESLRLTMSAVQQRVATRGSKPGATADKAYGANGYLFPTPLHLILDESTMDGLLQLMGERSAK